MSLAGDHVLPIALPPSLPNHNTPQILMAGVLLDVLRQANEQAGGIIPYTEFYNQARGARRGRLVGSFGGVNSMQGFWGA